MKASIKGFKDWLKTKNPDEEYSYILPSNCCYAQYLKETGICANPGVGPWSWYDRDVVDRKSTPIHIKIQTSVMTPDGTHKSTFGAALKRLKV